MGACTHPLWDGGTAGRLADSARASHVPCSENGITNGLEIFSSPQHADTCVVASNNDQAVRVYQVQPSGLR